MSNKKHGFTIIEVVLVLAIAGLIFLMVFVALPALQRSQRDTQRRSDMSRVATALTNWQANNNNSLPRESKSTDSTDISQNDAKRLLVEYLKGATDNSQSEFKDPDGSNYRMVIQKGSRTNANIHIIYILTGAICSGEKATSSGANAGNYAIMYKLEGSGTLCMDNQ